MRIEGKTDIGKPTYKPYWDTNPDTGTVSHTGVGLELISADN